MRYELRRVGSFGWGIYDNVRKALILKTISPTASYNKEAAQTAIDALNKLSNN